MSEPDTSAVVQSGVGERTTDEVVPHVWPAPEAPPMAANQRPVSWLLFPFVPLGIVLRPAAIGGRLARSSWFKAVAAHLLCILAIWAITVAAELVLDDGNYNTWTTSVSRLRIEAISWERLTWGERLRFPFALVFTILYDGAGDIDATTLAFAAAGAHASCWLIAALAMPLFAMGEPLRRLFGRCLKLVFWSNVCFVVAALCYAFVRVGVEGDWGGTWDDMLRTVLYDESVAGALTVLIFMPWWFNVLFRLAARYAGPTEGPGWQPPPPHCNGCGYTIIGLPKSGRCPECGRVIADSLPTARRPPAWAVVENWWRRPLAYARTVRDVLGDRRFFDTLAVRRPTREAARFAVWTCVVVGMLLALGFLAQAWADVAYAPNARKAIRELCPPVLGGLGVTAFSLAAVCLVALRSAFTVRIDPRITWNAVLYSSAFLLPTSAVVAAAWWADWLIDEYTDLSDSIYLGEWHAVEFNGEFFGWFLFGCCAFAASVWGLIRLRKAILDIRFAV
ncbi:MAG: hypothetical protein C4547_01580 [Phycisphaerales bacterium]|nr:MAG: hypothetical protein C4547_01580 [Phycisphaerales bacterium]